MLRRLIALAVASALAFGSIAARAEPLSSLQPRAAAQPTRVAKNEPPLKPAGAAGIRQAQGTADLDVWFISGVILAAIVAAILLADDDSTNSTDSTE